MGHESLFESCRTTIFKINLIIYCLFFFLNQKELIYIDNSIEWLKPTQSWNIVEKQHIRCSFSIFPTKNPTTKERCKENKNGKSQWQGKYGWQQRKNDQDVASSKNPIPTY